MRKILILVSVLFGINLNAQTWFEVAATGGGGLSWILSSNVFQDQKHIQTNIAPAYGGGLKFGVNFNENHMLNLYGAYNIKNQSLIFKFDSLAEAKKKITLNCIDIGLLYRNNSGTGGFVEVGPQLSMVKSANENTDGNSVDVSDAFNKTYVSGVLGFGGNLVTANAFTWTLGVRFSYAFTDLLSDNGGKGNTVSYPTNKLPYTRNYPNYKPTTNFNIMLNTEFVFDLGYFAKANCKRGRATFMRFK